VAQVPREWRDWLAVPTRKRVPLASFHEPRQKKEEDHEDHEEHDDEESDEEAALEGETEEEKTKTESKKINVS